MSNTYSVRVNTPVAPIVKVNKKTGIEPLNPVEIRTSTTTSKLAELSDVNVSNLVNGSVPVYQTNTSTFLVRPLTFADIGGNLTNLSLTTATIGTLTANVANVANLSISKLYANGSLGSNGQVLTSNGSGSYWANTAVQGITSIATGNGISGGPITNTGTLDLVVGSTLVTNSTGIHVNPVLTISDLTVTGNVLIQGSTTTVDTNTLLVKDNMIGMGTSQANSASFLDVVDAGFYTVFGNTSAKFYAGLARVASLSSNTNPYFKLYGTNVNPDGSVIDTGVSLGTLAAKLAAPGLTANATAVGITANSTFNVAIVANTLQFDTLDCGTYT